MQALAFSTRGLPMPPELSYELTVEQQFQATLMQRQVQEMYPSQMRELLMQLATQLMVKDNFVR